MNANGIITLTTDFGLQDMFVGVMKGVMLGIAPDARLVDITHDLPNQSVDAADFVLAHSASYFPPGTTHMVVVDPGVGTARRMIAVACNGQFFVAPDNGALSSVLREADCPVIHEITNANYFTPSPVGNTFHGRDVFAPIAAHLAAGVAIEELGPRVDDPVLRPELSPDVSPGRLVGRITYIDKFGNAMTNITRADISTAFARAKCTATAGPQTSRLVSTYTDGAPGTELIALINSWGLIEFAVNQGHAAQFADLTVGQEVMLGSSDK
ncbi:hypothetical protein BVY04_01815 [bacterium M21]|nr:hypothetical protein BVY04_01815 [bacterium M21]